MKQSEIIERFTNPRYCGKTYRSVDEMCDDFSGVIQYLKDLPQKEFFELIDETIISAMSDARRPDLAASMAVLRNMLRQSQSSVMQIRNDGYRVGRHC